MVKVKARLSGNVKRKPVKAGSKMPRNIGGALNSKLVFSVKNKKRNG